MPSNNSYQPLTSHGSYYPSQNANVVLRPISVEEACAGGSPLPPLQLHDRVVWLSDTGPEYGIVKWLGKLPDVGTEWMAGVDFVNPVGSGTGLYNEFKLFETKMNHASLVPIVGLMKATDYLGTTNIEESLPPQKPKRTKQKSGSSDTYKFYTEKESPSLSRNVPIDPNNKGGSPNYNAEVEMLTSDINSISLANKGTSFVNLTLEANMAYYF